MSNRKVIKRYRIRRRVEVRRWEKVCGIARFFSDEPIAPGLSIRRNAASHTRYSIIRPDNYRAMSETTARLGRGQEFNL